MSNLLKEVAIVEGDTSNILTIYDESAHTKIGALNNLTTTNKSNIVNAINEVDDNIDDEITARINADTAEQTARENADTALQNSITAEQRARTNADTSINNKIGTLTNLNTSNKSNLVNAINEVLSTASVINKKYIMVGDSYAIGSNGSVGWINKVNSILGLTRGVDSFDSRDVSTYFGGSFSANTFTTQLTDCLTLISDPSSITDICVFAGQNEYAGGTVAEMETNFDSFVAYANNHYPNAKIHVGFIGHGSDYTLFEQMNERAREYIRLAQKNGCHYVTNIEYVNRLYSLYTNDSIHPNDFTDMANYIAEGIINGSVDVLRRKSYDLTLNTHGSGRATLIINQHNGLCTVDITLSNVTTNSTINGASTYHTGLELCTLPRLDIISGAIDLPPVCVVSRNVDTSVTTYATNPIVVFTIVNTNTVTKLYVRSVLTTGTGWLPVAPSASFTATSKITSSFNCINY